MFLPSVSPWLEALIGSCCHRCRASVEGKQAILERDLDLTNRSLKLNPKNYSVWEHRKWVLETMPDADWSLEIKMVELYLEKDGRNCEDRSVFSIFCLVLTESDGILLTRAVHSWDYRRYLISSILSIFQDPERLKLRTKPLPNPLPTTESELQFTTRKISKNFSNFSAWHYRTKLLTKLWEEKGWEDEGNEERRKRVDQG